jgi:aspartate/methionine/tyrosine aminotransferase
MEPAFDIYSAQIQMAGGKCVYVPLRPPDATSPTAWHLDWDEFERAFSERTRLVVLNTPHNPTGKVFRREELERIAAIVQRHPRVRG